MRVIVELNSPILCLIFLTSLASSLTLQKPPSSNTIKGGIGAPCISDKDCSEDVLDSVCLSIPENPLIKFCGCVGGGVVEADGNCFKLPEQLGDRCKVADSCPTANSNCAPDSNQGEGYGICECSQGFFEFAKHCETMPAKLGDKCSEADQCLAAVAFTQCEASDLPDTLGSCKCQVSYSQNPADDKCYPTKVGLACTESPQCSYSLGPASECQLPEKICACMISQGYPNEKLDFCLPYAINVGDSCEELKQCMNLIDATTVQCSVPPDGGPQACICMPDHVISASLKGCLPLVDYGEKCDESVQCGNVEGIACRNDECRCDDNHLPEQDKCYLLADEIGLPCEVQLQCTERLENATCGIDETCSCPDGSVPDSGLTNTRCLSKYLEGFVCKIDAECQHIPFSNCLPPFDVDNPDKSTRCRCNEAEDIVGGANRDKCLLPAALVGDECELDLQCKLIVGSECKVGPGGTGSCQCKQFLEPDPSNTRCIEEPPTK